MAIDHVRRARRAWSILVQRACARKLPLSYGELCRKIGLHHRAARWFLGVIQTYCEDHGLPPLQALAVNKKTRVPGSGYVASGRSKEQHRKAVEDVWEYKKWASKPPSFKGL